jgi:hypothetical protein
MKYLNKIEEILKGWGTVYKGCSSNQINNIEQKNWKKAAFVLQGISRKFGYDMDRKDDHSRGGFVGESIFFDNVYGDHTNKDGLIEQLQDDNKSTMLPQINDNILVFFHHKDIFSRFQIERW